METKFPRILMIARQRTWATALCVLLTIMTQSHDVWAQATPARRDRLRYFRTIVDIRVERVR